MKLIIGIDEAGRGPLAGPVTVGIFGAEEKIGKWLLKNIFNSKLRDSKKLSPQKREEIYKKFLELKKDHKINFSVSHISNKIIDKIGISKAVEIGIKKCLKNLEIENLLKIENSKLKIKLDGLLKAPIQYPDQETIVGGDAKNIFIACASIVAKVSRDKLICRLAKKYPNYGFEIHKGYGTLAHRHLIQKYGPSFLHRRSYCKNIINMV